jgi:hypothetical protein
VTRVLPPTLIERTDYTAGKQYRAIIAERIFIVSYQGEIIRLRTDSLWQNYAVIRSMVYYCETLANKGAAKLNKIFQTDQFKVIELTAHK